LNVVPMSDAGPPCDPGRAKGIVTGSVASHGEKLAVHLRVLSCTDGAPLADAESAAALGDILEAVGQAVRQIRIQLGEPASSVRKFDVPLSSATSASLEALQGMSSPWMLSAPREY